MAGTPGAASAGARVDVVERQIAMEFEISTRDQEIKTLRRRLEVATLQVQFLTEQLERIRVLAGKREGGS